MDPKQAREIAQEQGSPLSLGRKTDLTAGHLMNRLLREQRQGEQKGIDVAAFTSSV